MADETIRKFCIPRALPNTVSRVRMPAKARLLHVASDEFGNVTLWALCDGSHVPIDREFLVLGTDYAVPPGWQHVGSAHHGDITRHVFEPFYQAVQD